MRRGCRDAKARRRLQADLERLGLPQPDMLPLSAALAYAGAAAGEAPGWAGAGAAAHRLVAAACAGTDPALPLPLPHSRALQRSRRGARRPPCRVLVPGVQGDSGAALWAPAARCPAGGGS